MQELYNLLVDDAEDLLDVIKTTITQQPFQLICQRLLHHLDNDKLLDFLSGILGQSYSQHQLQQLVSANSFGPVSSPGGTATWVTSQLEQCLQLIIFGCILWRDLGSLSTHAALAFRFQQLHTSWQGSGKLQVLLHTIGHALSHGYCIHAKVMRSLKGTAYMQRSCAHLVLNISQAQVVHVHATSPCPTEQTFRLRDKVSQYAIPLHHVLMFLINGRMLLVVTQADGDDCQFCTVYLTAYGMQDICNAAQLICSAETAPVHWALLKFNTRDSSNTMYQDMLHSLWAVQCTIQHWSSHSDEQQILFLADAGIHGTMLSSGQHSILRPSKKHKPHKHKQRKSHKKSRKGREMLPSSGEESLSDNDLGIMTPDAGDRMPLAAGNWLLHMGRPEPSQVQISAQGLPAVLLHQVLSGWTEYCFTLL